MNTRPVHVPRPCLALMLAVALGGIAPNLASADSININPSKDNTLYEYVPALTISAMVLAITSSPERQPKPRQHPPGRACFRHCWKRSGRLNDHKRELDHAYVQNTLTRPLESLNCTSSSQTGEKEPPTPPQTRAREHQPPPMMPHGGTVSTILFFGRRKVGTFPATASASQSVGSIGSYTWSSAQMVADVQSWLDNPASNFGWLVRGDESSSTTAKRFDTRESASPPVLTIQYTASTPSPTPTASPTATPTPIKHAHANSDRHRKSDNNTYTNSLADTFFASVAVPTRRHRDERVDRYR